MKFSQIQKSLFLIAALMLLSAVVPGGARAAAPAGRPNILVILADDCTYNDLPVYGGQNAKTPSIDRLASQGLVFNRAYVSAAMCQPCRAELYTGQYPMHNGCAWNHSASRPGTRSLPQHLGAQGYRVGLAGKSHVLPEASFPFEEVPGFDPNCVRNPTQNHDLAGVRSFMTQDAAQPFCLVVALVEPHVPWVMGDASQYPPRKIKLPPNIADTPRTREDFGRYLAEITYMDGQVREILDLLKNQGLEENTLVLFSSEQGSQFPGNKWTNWDTGLHTALIARWPGHVPAGKRTDALVQYADVLPTLLETGGASPEALKASGVDGLSFAAVLQGKEQKGPRTHAYAMHNNIPEGSSYPIRTVSDGEYRYIRNLTPDEIYIEKHVMGAGALNNPYWPTWMGSSWDRPATYSLVKRYLHRPAEELYHTSADAYEMTNLAGDAKLAAVKERLSAELDRWLAEQKDPGIPLDTHEAQQAAKDGRHRH